MAAVDSLLKLISARSAQALTIGANAVPELRKGGELMPLSMPPLARVIVEGFLNEIGGPAVRTYSSADGAAYSVTIEGAGDELRMNFVPAEALRSVAPAPIMMPVAAVRSPDGNFESLLEEVERLGASDLVLSSGMNAWLRVNGAMRVMPQTALSENQIIEALGLGIEGEALDASGSLDFAMERTCRYRVNVFRQSRGIAAALRPIRIDPPSLEKLGLPESLHDLVKLRNGLVLVAVAAGSGKSTTLYALIEYLNRTASRHIITLEDPIEYQYQNRSCLIHQREIGSQVPDFATGLRACLRESPDVILVGEMRDKETCAAAITAAETGHLVLCTIHASSAMVALDAENTASGRPELLKSRHAVRDRFGEPTGFAKPLADPQDSRPSSLAR